MLCYLNYSVVLKRDKPMTRNRVQPWDLFLILHAFTQAPFEPLKSVPLKFPYVENSFSYRFSIWEEMLRNSCYS